MENESVTPGSTVGKSLPSGAIVLFVVAAIGMCGLVLLAQLVVWNLEQTAIADGSFASLGNSGKIWFPIQALLVGGLAGLGVAISKSAFRPVYRSWMLAALVTFPMWALRFLGPNADQAGAGLQILLAVLAAAVLVITGRQNWKADRRVLFALTLAALGIWPFLLWGALGSGTDTLINLLAGLAFGGLAGSLAATNGHNRLLDGIGIGVLLAILASAFGYDGSQLLLLTVVPFFGLALAPAADSRPAIALGAGLLATAPLVFIDPTELTIVLGDLLPWALKAALLMAGIGLMLGIVALAAFRRPVSLDDSSQFPRFPAAVPVIAWVLAAALYGFFGLHGFAGDRLFVVLKDQADVSRASSIADKTERRTFVYETLTKRADAGQADLRQTLDRFGIHYKPYYLVNAMEVDGGALVRLYLESRPEVDRVIPSPRLRPIPAGENGLQGFETRISENPGWNIQLIEADKVWSEFGVSGKGVVVGQSDTGADGEHLALKDSYRGVTSGNDYNWYDPWSGSRAPEDKQGHGTHTLGSVLGNGGIGVAPDAQWIACINLERNLGNPALYLECMQFMLAPFPLDGDPLKDGDPSRGADVLNNSWGCPTLEGCDAESLRPAAEALRRAGIFVVVSAGNDGPNCGTLTNPPAIYDSVFSVGAVDRSGSMAFFSSRGPVTVDGSGRVKPDIAAPGLDVFSSLPGGTYGTESGTSMAGPHVAGVVALLWSAQPDLVGDIERTEQILTETAKPYSGTRSEEQCFTGSNPNDAYGYGVVDAYAAVKMALGK